MLLTSKFKTNGGEREIEIICFVLLSYGPHLSFSSPLNPQSHTASWRQSPHLGSNVDWLLCIHLVWKMRRSHLDSYLSCQKPFICKWLMKIKWLLNALENDYIQTLYNSEKKCYKSAVVFSYKKKWKKKITFKL